MEFLSNFNGIEVIFILILVLILFGPEKLPEIAGKIGSTLGKLRRASSQIMAEWSREAGLEDISREGEQLSNTINQSIQETRETLQPENHRSRRPSRESTDPADLQEETPGETHQTGPQQQDPLQGRLAELEREIQHLRGQLAELESRPDQGENQDD